MIEKLTKSYDNSGVGLLLPDLTKAFDSLRRDLLIAKPATYCFFFYNNVVHKIQTVFLTNKKSKGIIIIKRGTIQIQYP